MGLKLNGATSGSIEIDVPAVAGTDTAITIPATSGGEFIVSDSSGNIDLGPLDINGGASDDSVNIDGSGRLLVGTTSSRSVDNEKILQIEGTGQQTSSMSLTRNTNSAAPPNISFGKSRGSTNGSNTIVQSGDSLGVIVFCGADGSDTNSVAAAITGQVDGTPGSNDMPGRLVFSTTADGSDSPTERMRIRADGGVRIFSTGPSTRISSTQSAGTAEWFLIGSHSATAVDTGTNSFIVWTNGDVQNTNNQYTAISDIKLKENIADAKSQWDDIKGLRLVNYNFKPETGAETHKQLGLIAQEVETVCPGLVGETADLDENGDPTGEVTKNVAYSVLYMKAVGALQEAMERIETLEAKVAQLEGGAA